MDRVYPQHGGSPAPTRPAPAPVAFLSYAHTESQIALRFREALASHGLTILIDIEHLKLGEDISDFARRAVRAADATICVVSAASLSSAWVVFEAVTTLHKEYANPNALLIACATDDAFFAPDFRLAVTRSIDERLATINQLLAQYLKEQLDMNDLSMERSRLLTMRATLGDILARLRNSLTLKLTAETLIATAMRIADHIRELRGQPPSRSDPRDIRARAEELRRHMWDGRTDDALDRMLDFVREFSDLPKHVRDATFLANTLRRIEKAEKEAGLAFSAAEEQRQPTIYKLLELIDEIELHPSLPLAS